MKHVRRLGSALLSLLAGALLVVAEGPDDLFVQVYNLVQQADAQRANGQLQDAQAKYIAAGKLLDKLQASYPNWNERIVNYRRRYIAERLGPDAAALLAKPAAATPATSPAAPAPVAPGPARPDDALTVLAQEVTALRTECDTLRAKLREALSVQPAAVDPRELAKAERRLQDLRTENDALKANVAQQQAKLASAPDPAAYTEAQKALREAKDALERQTRAVTSLTKERDALQQQLKRATDKAQARATKEEQKAAKAAPTAPTAPVADPAKAAELESKLKQAQEALAAERNRSEVLQAEKAALEKRVTELAAAKPPVPPATPPATTAAKPAEAPAAAPTAAPASADAAAAPAKPAPTAQTKSEKAAEKALVKQLTRERDDLRKRVSALTRELDERRLRSGSGQNDRLVEELAILRTRIQVYETRQVPYTPDELAQLKLSAGVSAQTDGPTPRKSARQVPAGAATLVVEAQRAFQGRRLDEAEKKFQQALVLDERNLGLLVDLAATHLEQGRLDAAEAMLKRASAVDPNDPDLLALLGLLRFRQGKYDEAMDTLGRAVQYNPDNALAQNYLGVTLSQKGQRQPAETAFRKALQREPNYAEAHYNLAIVYANAKPPSLELARWHYQKAIAGGQPRNPEIEKLIDLASGKPPAK